MLSSFSTFWSLRVFVRNPKSWNPESYCIRCLRYLLTGFCVIHIRNVLRIWANEKPFTRNKNIKPWNILKKAWTYQSDICVRFGIQRLQIYSIEGFRSRICPVQRKVGLWCWCQKRQSFDPTFSVARINVKHGINKSSKSGFDITKSTQNWIQRSVNSWQKNFFWMKREVHIWSHYSWITFVWNKLKKMKRYKVMGQGGRIQSEKKNQQI